MTNAVNEQQLDTLQQKIQASRTMMARQVIGQQQVMEEIFIALLAGGHCLIEGVPGLGKTLLVKTLANICQLGFQRIQFTPDLMPGDVIGTEVLEEDHTTGKRFFKFQQGPVFTQLLLADEINRTPPKTQAALLEAMQEHTVSYAGQRHQLPEPFFVLATQNPVEQAGTYPLPEAQLDRFLLMINIDYPTEADELKVLQLTTGSDEVSLEATLTQDDLMLLQQITRDVFVSEELMKRINRLVRATRPDQSPLENVRHWVEWGAGPRAGQALILCSKARALLNNRLSITPEDVVALLHPVLRHRLLLNFKAEVDQVSIDQVINELAEHF